MRTRAEKKKKKIKNDNNIYIYIYIYKFKWSRSVCDLHCSRNLRLSNTNSNEPAIFPQIKAN